MKKILVRTILSLLLIHFTSGNLFAQNSSRDSIVNLGNADGRKLQLSPIERVRFKTDQHNYNSDLFKPNISVVPDTSLLKILPL